MTTPDADGHLARQDGGRPPNRAADGGAAKPPLSDAIADAVKTGYDVLDKNLQKGRTIAEKFREGRYGIDEAPGDVKEISDRVIRLTRELAQLSTRILERILHEGAAPGPSAGALAVTVKVEGNRKAESPTKSLNRPANPATASDITADPLVTSGGDGKPIADVGFESDLSSGGLIVTVKLPQDQAPGVYSGRVFVKTDPVPLGLLILKVLE